MTEGQDSSLIEALFHIHENSGGPDKPYYVSWDLAAIMVIRRPARMLNLFSSLDGGCTMYCTFPHRLLRYGGTISTTVLCCQHSSDSLLTRP